MLVTNLSFYFGKPLQKNSSKNKRTRHHRNRKGKNSSKQYSTRILASFTRDTRACHLQANLQVAENVSVPVPLNTAQDLVTYTSFIEQAVREVTLCVWSDKRLNIKCPEKAIRGLLIIPFIITTLFGPFCLFPLCLREHLKPFYLEKLFVCLDNLLRL